jgi:hypothetical protein
MLPSTRLGVAMSEVAGVYGFTITRAIDLPNVRIEPVTGNGREAHELARDQSALRLTATVRSETLDARFLFNLEAVLAFVERLDVLVTAPLSTGSSDQQCPFQAVVATHLRHSGGGPVLPEDTWSRESRGEFIRQAMSHLSDEAFCSSTTFNTFLFKYVESFRQRKPLIEVSWFLLYSGLEAFARATQNDYQSRNASVPITSLLQSHGFNILQDDPVDLRRSVATYTRLRNALFHNGRRDVQVTQDGRTFTLQMEEYVANFQQLVALTILKAVGFDDGHINWDSWMDWKPFK